MSGVPKFPSITGSLWKFATIGAGVVSLILVSLLLASYFENRNLQGQNTALTAQINDPTTGYVAQLAQARTNVSQLQTTITTMRVRFQTQADENNVKLVQTERLLAAAQAQTRTMQERLNHFLSTGPQGTTTIDQYNDINDRITAELNHE